MQFARAWLAVAALAAGCTTTPEPRAPLPITPAGDQQGAAVVRREMPAAPVAATAPASPPVTAAPIVLPPDIQYVCVTGSGGDRRQVSIQFDPKVAELCRKHPEMGPCQYERNACRASGGRVYAADGVEITMQTEAEYDKRVMRVRFKAN
jgi:hypothetical protein